MIFLPPSTKVAACIGETLILVIPALSVGLPNKSICPLVCALVSEIENSSPKTLLPNVLNSNSAKRGSNFSLSGGPSLKLSSWNSTGASNIIVANLFDSKPCSAKASTFSFCLPFNSWLLAMMFSIEPYCLISNLAVFSPMPGIPGMLSTASPHKPKISITWCTCSISHFANTSFTPIISISFPIRAGL